MSKYTTELRYLCEFYAGRDKSAGFADVEKIIAQAAPKVFDFTFPIYDEDYRLPLEIKIIRHFYTREICEETVGLWKLRLSARLNEIMPYFNELYKSAALEFDPLGNEKYTRTYSRNATDDRTDNGTSKNTTEETGKTTIAKSDESNSATTGEATGYNYESDTPQGSIGNDAWLTYLSKISKDISNTSGNVKYTGSEDSTNNSTKNQTVNGTTDNTTKIKTVEEYTESILGKSGGESFAKMLKEYRETLINIDEQIISRLNDLFFILW